MVHRPEIGPSFTVVELRFMANQPGNEALLDAVNDLLAHGARESDQEPATIDAEMKALWEKLGSDVHMLGDLNAFARRQGVVHCIKKYLRRGE